MKYAVDMGSGTMIYILGFIKIGSDIRKLIRRDTQPDMKIAQTYFQFSKEESRLKAEQKGGLPRTG